LADITNSTAPPSTGISSIATSFDKTGYLIGSSTSAGTFIFLPHLPSPQSKEKQYRITTTNLLSHHTSSSSSNPSAPKSSPKFSSPLLNRAPPPESTYGKIIKIIPLTSTIILLLPSPSPHPLLITLPENVVKSGAILPLPDSDNLANVGVMEMSVGNEVLVSGDDNGHVRVWPVDCAVRAGRSRFGFDSVGDGGGDGSEAKIGGSSGGGFVERGEDRRKEIEKPFFMQFKAHNGPVTAMAFVRGRGGNDVEERKCKEEDDR